MKKSPPGFLKANFKPEVGFKYTFEAGEEEDCTQITGIVKSASPYKLIYTWIVEDTNVETTVSWSLEAHEGQTKLVLEHSGISNYDDASAVKFFKDFNGGWDNCLSGLTDYLKSEIHA